MGYDIHTHGGAVPRPTCIKFWDETKFKAVQPEAPFHYGADALVGLSIVHLNRHLQNPFATPRMNYPFASESWKALEPHHELFARSQPRILALQESLKHQAGKSDPAILAFERKLTEIVDNCLATKCFELSPLEDLIEAVHELEEESGRPLLYNFQMHFTRETLTQLQHLHSLLFNLRALITMDYNAHVQDAAHDALKIDSISDYLAKAEYVANDAALYWGYKKCEKEMPAATQTKMNSYFWTYSHNACTLIENLPKSFLNKFKTEELDEALYLVQMDWLLGTDAGVLFRLREEIYGLSEGYEKVFYPEAAGRPASHLPSVLAVNCEVTEQTLYPHSDAA